MAFDVYRAVGGSERTRIVTMKALRDRVRRRHRDPGGRLAARRPGHLPARPPARQLAAVPRTPPVPPRGLGPAPRVRPSRASTPTTATPTELVERWRERAVRRRTGSLDDAAGHQRHAPRRDADGDRSRGAPRRPDRRRRAVRHRRGVPRADRLPVGHLRDLRGPRRHRRHLGPVPLPGHPLGLGHVHPRLPVPARGTRTGPSSDGERSCSTSRDTAAEVGIDRQIRFGHRIVAADWSSEDGRWHVEPRRTDADGGVHDVELTCWFLFSCSGYYRYDRGHLPDFAGIERLRRHRRAPAALAGGPGRRRASGSWSSAAARRRSPSCPSLAARAAHVTMLQRSPTYIASLPGTNPLTAAAPPGAAASAGWAPALRWTNALVTQAFYQLSKRRPGRWSSGSCARASSASCRPATTSTPTSRPATTRGTSACASVPDGDLFRAHPRGPRVGRHRPHRHLHPDRHPAAIRRRARRGHHRDRHRAGAAVPGRHRADRRRRAGRRRRSG